MLDALRQKLLRRLDKVSARLEPGPTAVDAQSAAGEALRVQGNGQLANGDLVAAESSYRLALEQLPQDGKVLNCLAYVLSEQGRLVEAVVYLKRAQLLPPGPDLVEALFLLGDISERRQEWERALASYQEALRLDPTFIRACAALCGILFNQERLGEIRTLLERCVTVCPELPQYRLMLAKACFTDYDVARGVECLQAVLAMGVQDARLSMDLGANLLRLARPEEAGAHLERAQQLEPQLAFEAAYHWGYYHVREGNAELAAHWLEQAVQAQPDYLPAHSLLVVLCSYSDRQSVAGRSYAELATRYANLLPSSDLPDATPPTAGRRLRVGFVSGELRGHPVGYFLLDVLQHIDRQRFEVWAYSNNPISDQYTTLLQAQFDAWHNIRRLDDATLVDTIRTQAPDILIDLGGHTGDGRLAIFSQRMAPVQVSWLGYWASTGVRNIDYFLADPLCLPESATQWFSEQVYRLPHTRLCMSAPRLAQPVAVGPCPSGEKGFVTFASFQQVTKISPLVLATWARVLQAVPQSRLRLQAQGADTPAMREKVEAAMAGAGVDPGRVQMFGVDTLEAYLQAHNSVDLLLDTFPYAGGTTTAYALWMGVPTVTLEGDTVLSRQGLAMLHLVGLPECVARDPDQYVEIAQRLANDLPTRARWRDNLRAQALASALFDTPAFATDFQAALQDMVARRQA